MVHIPLSNECFQLDLLLLKNSIEEQTKHGKWKLIIMEILFKNPNLSRICWQGISKSKYSNSCSEFPWVLPQYGTKYLRWKHQNSIYSDPDVKLLYIRHQDEWFRVFLHLLMDFASCISTFLKEVIWKEVKSLLS